MGRKDKEEDRDREARDSRKRRLKARSPSRSKSRSKSRDRELPRVKKTKSEHPREEKDRNRDERNRDKEKDRSTISRKERDAPRERDEREKREAPSEKRRGTPPPPTASSTNETSISIEETNRIRAELGLKPLETGGESNEATSTEKKDVHVPAENLREKKATEEIRRKLEERKEKRKIEQRLASVKTLAETATEEDDDASNWVEKSRKIQQAKEEALKRAKMLEEMDQAFGVGDIVNTELVKEKSNSYTGRDLKGLKVEHDRESIAEGKAVVMTLKDQYILEGEEDVLVNVNMLDDERYKKNNEVKKQKPGYQAYEEDLDELGLPKTKSLLAKYDSEIDGERKDSFVLGRAGDEESKRKAMDDVKEKLKLQQKKMESLESQPLQIASEYYTEQEMTFKKVKRRVKKVRSKGLKADDLLEEGAAAAGSGDLGSRSRIKEPTLDTDDTPGSVDLSGVKLTIDENQLELRQALEKAKRRKLRQREEEVGDGGWNAEAMIRSIKSEPMDMDTSRLDGGYGATDADEDDLNKGIITMNSVAEYCRQLGDIPTYGMAGNRDEDEDELMDFERQLAEERKRNQEKEERKREAERLQERGGWNVVDKNKDDGASDDSMDVDHDDSIGGGNVILDEEPIAGTGMAATLKLAINKGYLEKEEIKRVTVSKIPKELLSKHEIDDKVNKGEDDKYSRRNRFDGPVTEFKEKEGYKPTLKLEYIDDNGKALSTKEAFRHLSHKFHGKGSGKLKSEKRAKKQEDKSLMNRMSSTDTPLNTLKKLQDKQKELHSPYVVLSGKGMTASIAKPGKGKK